MAAELVNKDTLSVRVRDQLRASICVYIFWYVFGCISRWIWTNKPGLCSFASKIEFVLETVTQNYLRGVNT